MPRGMTKVSVCREQQEIVPNAKPCNQGIDRLDLNAFAAASVANLSRFDMVLAVWRNYRQDRKSFDDGVAILGTREALKQLLQHQAGGIDRFPRAESAPQPIYLRSIAWRVPTKGK